ncbi:MAG: tetratricopeptide repeat protein [Myxococcota bacterium]
MNGFEWLDDLQPDQQRRMHQLIEAVSEGDNERVEAMTPALLDEAASNGQPWVEVFVRNFYLRSLVFNREDARQALPQAVSLLERANREDTQGCPQSVCASHVLTAAYTLTDPQGYAEKREAVSRETLDGLEPDRICFVCISNEVAKALIDQGRSEEALQFIEQQKQIRRERGIDFDPDDFARTEATALLAVQQHADALKVVEAGLKAGTEYRGESWMNEIRQLQSWILAESGEGERALEQLPDLGQIFRDGGFETHRRLLVRLVQDAHVGPVPAAVRLLHLAGEALRRGLADTGIHASVQASEWLHKGGHPRLAAAVRERCREHLDALVDPDRYQAVLERVAQLPAVEPDESSIAALHAQPATVEQLRLIASRWQQMGFHDRADATLADAARQFPNDIGLYEARCMQAIRSRDADLVQSLVSEPPDHPEGIDNARFYEGIFAHESGEESRAIEAFEWVWARRQDWGEVAKRLGKLLLQSRPARSLEVWQQAADAQDAPYFRWMAMVAATLAEDWPAQCQLAATLGLPELPDDRRADESWNYLRIRIPEHPETFLAQRTGPVTARLLSLRSPGEAQQHGAIVVFNPEHNNADEVAEDDDVLRIHDAWAQIEPPTKTCVTLDGIWPGADATQALCEALDEAGFFHQAAAGEGYEITDPATGQTHRGHYRFLAVDDASGEALKALLEAHRPDHGPWVYHELLDQLKMPNEAESQRALAQAWGMI